MGKVIMSGIVKPVTKPLSGIPASEFAVGSTVKLMMNGTATDFLVVNQGVPSPSGLYDASCDGTWLLSKDLYELKTWHSSNVNSYKSSTIHTYLNGDFFNTLGSIEQSSIRQVKIPYVNGNGSSGSVASGASGLSTKVFLLSLYETGYYNDGITYENFFVDGAKLSYFVKGDGTEARNQRVAYYNGTGTYWWTRSPCQGATTNVYHIRLSNSGFGGTKPSENNYGIRPALVLPSNALFDKNTLLLKGVA